MFGLGPWELLIVIIVIALIVMPYRIIFRKAGFSPAIGFLMIIPIVNYIVLWYLALAKWPSLQRPSQVDEVKV